jgi:hypothetical protein
LSAAESEQLLIAALAQEGVVKAGDRDDERLAAVIEVGGESGARVAVGDADGARGEAPRPRGEPVGGGRDLLRVVEGLGAEGGIGRDRRLPDVEMVEENPRCN